MSTQSQQEIDQIDISKQTMCCNNTNTIAMGYAAGAEGRCYEHTHMDFDADYGCHTRFLRGGMADRPLDTHTLFPISIITNTPTTNTCAGDFPFFSPAATLLLWLDS